MPNPEHLRVLALGAGVQSSTLALMIASGEVESVDCAIFADTQSEPSSVYAWLDWLEKQLPYPVYRVTAGSLRDQVMAAAIYKTRVSNPPLFTSGQGMLMRSCTKDFKLVPIQRKVRELRAGRSVEMLLGISWDEATRMKPSRIPYIRHYFPLVERELTRGHCLEWMAAKGYATPPKSACTFCPYHDDKMWQDMKTNDPESFASAVEVDETIRHGIYKTTRKLFLHVSRTPLSEVDFRSDEDMGQGVLFGNECEGMCGV